LAGGCPIHDLSHAGQLAVGKIGVAGEIDQAAEGFGRDGGMKFRPIGRSRERHHAAATVGVEAGRHERGDHPFGLAAENRKDPVRVPMGLGLGLAAERREKRFLTGSVEDCRLLAKPG
jgi:hypothetical protein